MADDTAFQGITTSFIENRQESDNTNYLEKDKSQVMRNELQATIMEERITNNRLMMNIVFHVLIFIFSTVLIWIKIKLFSNVEDFEGHHNMIYFSVLDFSYYNVDTCEIYTFPYPCAVTQTIGEAKKCVLQDYCNTLQLPNIFEYFKFEVCDEFSTINFFGMFVSISFI
jgi:hypothetical protein